MSSQSLSGWDGVFHWLMFEERVEEWKTSQSLSGWDGVFHRKTIEIRGLGKLPVAIPFRVGWGFSLALLGVGLGFLKEKSQSLSGWDGVFHITFNDEADLRKYLVAIPFRVGWGFSPPKMPAGDRPGARLSQSLSGWDGVFHRKASSPQRGRRCCRNPFQGGMGFFTRG